MNKQPLANPISSKHYKNLGHVLAYLMKECNIDATQLAQHTGVPISTIIRLRNSNKLSNPTLASLTPLAEFFCIRISQLIGEEPLDENRMKGAFKILRKSNLLIPILSWEQIISWPEIKDNLFEDMEKNAWLTINEHENNLSFALRQQGEAMEPKFPNGALLIFNPEQPVASRDFVLVLFEGKKLPIFRQILIDGENKYLRTLNPDLKDSKNITDDNYKILGIVTQVRMDFKQTEPS